MASDEGANFVAEAVKSIEKVRADVAALLALDSQADRLGHDSRKPVDQARNGAGQHLRHRQRQLKPIPLRPSGQTAPREEDILDEIDDILDALSSEDSFVAATAEDGGGAFESQALGAGAAADAFNRAMWTADATMGMTGSTRYGTALRKTSGHAKGASVENEGGVFGAFSYSTMQQTLRSADAAAVSLTGIASYSGGTRAVKCVRQDLLGHDGPAGALQGQLGQRRGERAGGRRRASLAAQLRRRGPDRAGRRDSAAERHVEQCRGPHEPRRRDLLHRQLGAAAARQQRYEHIRGHPAGPGC